MANKDRTSLASQPKPKRESTNQPWTTNLDLAAQMRAMGLGWDKIGPELGLSTATVQDYPSREENFHELVSWYRNQLWAEEVEKLIESLWPEALEALLNVLQRFNEDDEGKPKDAINAAKTALKATGFTKSQDTKRKLEQQKEMTGTPGDQLTLRTEDYEEMDDEELEEKIHHLREVTDE